MIKRVFTFLILGFFITFKCLTWVPAAAVSGIPAIDALEYTILQTIAMATQNGADIDFTDSLAEIIHDVNEGTFSIEYGAKELLKRYAAKAWDQINIIYDDLNDNNALDYVSLALQSASGLPSSMISEINRMYQNKVLDNDYELKTSSKDFFIAYWNKFNTNYINEYVERMNAVPEDVVVPDPPSDYATLCNEIESDIVNGHSFFSYPLYIRTWDIPSGGSIENFRINFLFDDCSLFTTDYFSSNSVTQLTYSEHATLNISTTGDHVTLLVDGFTGNSLFYYQDSYSSTPQTIEFGNSTARVLDFSNDKWNIGNYNPYISNGINYNNSFNTLDAALNYVYQHFRNVNLFVDGIAWIFANTSSDISVNIPNGVIDSGTDDGKIVSNPIYWTVDSSTGNPIESKYNLDKLYDYLKTLIDGTNQDTTVSFDDLVDAGVIEDAEGNTLTDTDIGTKSIADVIADATTNIDDLSITGEIAGIIPPLPILPTFSAGPQGDPTAGFRGMSVLARIVNVTNRGLPDDIISMFYGIVASLIVLGLIKVLHK